MFISRRQFMGGVAVGLATPGLFRQMAAVAGSVLEPGNKDTILVVLQLSGGNDGLNTVIPFKDPSYAEARPTLKQSSSSILKLNDELGLHPALRGLSKLYEEKQVCVLQGVGYPMPNRSHFESMDIWHKATPSETEAYGWLGRVSPKIGAAGVALQVGGDQPHLALLGGTGYAPTLRSLDEYQLRGAEGEKRRTVEKLASDNAKSSKLAELVRRAASDSYRSSASLEKIRQQTRENDRYPKTGLGDRLKLISQLIDSHVTERIFYTTHDGFDTHAYQAESHEDLLKQLGDALEAFQKDLKERGHDQRVVTMVFSEFGRRVKENGSQGTDHGAAAPVFMIGGKIEAGVLGAHPSLTDLDDGDLKFHTDFRRIYSALLDQWLAVPSSEILLEKHEPLKLFT